MSAAISAAKSGAEVTLWERNEKLGKKLYITGKGRCNLTNDCSVTEFLTNVVNNPKFLMSALNRTTPADTISFFNDLGLVTKVERGRRVFPESDHSSDVIKYFKKALDNCGVTVCLNTRLKELRFSADSVTAVAEDGATGCFDAVIIATGGISYPATGSTGDGYKFAAKCGHTVIEPKPALTGLKVRGNKTAEMAGLALKNSSLTIKNGTKVLYTDSGELLFTHIGLSGALALSASSVINRLTDTSKLVAIVDLKPYVDETEESARVLKVFDANKNKDVINVLGELLPKSIINHVVAESGIAPHKKVNSITVSERERLVHTIKNLTFSIEGCEDIVGAVVTSGGVKVSEINPNDMSSKLEKRLFFAGEVIDVDALTGGYNIQIAISTGFAAGKGAAKLNVIRDDQHI